MSHIVQALLYIKHEEKNIERVIKEVSIHRIFMLKNLLIMVSLSQWMKTDNICIEIFWRNAKVGKIYLNEYERVSTLKNDVKDYIKFYNHRRFHETLQYKKPMKVYFESIKINDENYDKSEQSVG